METPVVTWRMGPALRIFVALVMLFFLLMGLGGAADLIESRSAAFFLPLLWSLGIDVYFWWLFFRPLIRLTPTELVLRNKYRTERVDLRTVQAVVPSSAGLVIMVDGRAAHTGWAVQKSTLAFLLHREGRADRIAEQIQQAARGVGAPAPPVLE
ncbi:hypothetical protein [Actinoallomurus rhizosphaericola]|uniref:hypothetical protein n=1 Tax=Actinoallomurus rhizosphaericola TaxID=2952536 RepID=UPI002093ED29|nr:hypothetical protein [Actinoallomurus rhizosphaericola]MCO5994905.1 hypothetical protein [Actinoallomurus rhizosphaericola]